MNRCSASIPWGYDTVDGERVSADRADYTAVNGRYRCPRCEKDLSLIRTARNRQFFRHVRSEWARGRAGETQHRQAIMRLVEALLARRDSGRVLLSLVFSTAGHRRFEFILSAASVQPEWRCPDSGRRIDLALLDTHGQPSLLIEVKHTHAVDAQKRGDLVPHLWIEVDAEDVLAGSDVLYVREHGNFPPAWSGEWLQATLPWPEQASRPPSSHKVQNHLPPSTLPSF